MDSTLLSNVETLLRAEDAAVYLSLASAALFAYDYLLTLDEEIEYFWSGPWTVSRFLYLSNRCLCLCSIILVRLAFFIRDPPLQTCEHLARADYWISVMSILMVQGILSLRAFHLFPSSLIARSLIIISVVAAAAIEVALLSQSLQHPNSISLTQLPPSSIGCSIPTPSTLWHMFIPALVDHTILFLFTVFRAAKARSFYSAPFLQRLLFEGGVFYLVILFTVGFTTIGSILTDDPTIHYPAEYSTFIISINSVSISRLMLSIHSLAADLGTDPIWLLNNAEMSRIKWKKGTCTGELIVEVNAAEGSSTELHNIDDCQVESGVLRPVSQSKPLLSGHI